MNSMGGVFSIHTTHTHTIMQPVQGTNLSQTPNIRNIHFILFGFRELHPMEMGNHPCMVIIVTILLFYFIILLYYIIIILLLYCYGYYKLGIRYA